nr:hypothetical protein [Tanacetum cinerariifolium]
MALIFADTHNMIAHLTKSNASEGFEQILDFLNASVINYALTVNPTIYVSSIKQFWFSVLVKKVNDVIRLEALINRKKVLITEDTVRQALRLDDAESINCLPNEEIFAKLARMGYEKPSTKLIFYKTFFLAQWKFLIHIILQCMSAKRIAWNEFSSSMASAVICLATSRKFNFSKYIFDSLVRNVDSSSKFYMYPRFLQLMIAAQVGDLTSHTTKYTSPALTQKVFANMKRVGKRFSRVNIPLFKGMLVQQQAADEVDDVVDDNVPANDVADVVADDVIADDVADVVAHAAAEPTQPSPTPTTTPPPSQELYSTSQVSPTPPLSPHQSPQQQPSSPPQQPQPSQTTTISMELLNNLLETCTGLTRRVENLEQDKIAQALKITKLKQRVKRLERKNNLKVSGLTRLRKVGTTQRVESSTDTVVDDQEDASKQGRLEESQAQVYHIDLEHADKVLSMQDDEPEPAELKEVIEVVTTAKLMTEVVTATATTITATAAPITAARITIAPSAAKRRKGVVIRDPDETATPSTIVHFEPKFKDKGKGTLVEEPKPLKKQAQIEQDEAYARELEAELNKNINWDDVIEHVKRKEKEDNVVLRKVKKSWKKRQAGHLRGRVKFLKRKQSKKQKYNEEVEELKKHLQIDPNDDDDVYTEATPLALKVLVVDYYIHIENNKPHYKIIRADGTHQLFLSFLSLLRNFDREDLEVLWQIVQERFASSKPNNFSNDFLLATLNAMFKKPDVEAQVWKNQKGIHGLAKVKSWRLLESCGVHIKTFITTQMILLVEGRYPLTRHTTSMPEPVKSKPKIICKPKVWTDAPIIEEYESDCDDDSVSNVPEDKEKPSFAFTDSVKHVKTSRENVKATSTPNHSPKVEK